MQSLHAPLVSLLLAVAPQPPPTLTYPQLVARMTDLSLLAILPPVGEKTSLASSYNRVSRYDAALDRYIRWGANADGSGVLRREGSQVVLADIQGPGCIWRIWSATPRRGHVKIFLDGGATPAVDLPFNEFFNGDVAPFNRPHIVYTLNGETEPPGFNNYTPISFARSCKIVADEGWGQYYQFTYTQFPPGTVVPTFQMKLSEADSAALDQAESILADSGRDRTAQSATAHTLVRELSVEPGKESVVAELTGAEAITEIKVSLDLPSDPEAQRVWLRELTVAIFWDGDRDPAVWSPLGDFFGFVGGADRYQSLPMGLLADGTFYCAWVMPFARSARLVVGNDGSAARAMKWQITHQPLEADPATLARFHAKWHRDAFLPTREDRRFDWTLLTTEGRGRYIGTHLHGWNPAGGWWGEGDDKFFIDGEKLPSSFGTGSEDYFGYAWSSAKRFSRPYHNQILNQRNAGHFDDNRWHIPDSVPFQTSFEGDLEKYFSNQKGTLYAAEAFWYLAAGGKDPYAPVPVAERLGYWNR